MEALFDVPAGAVNAYVSTAVLGRVTELRAEVELLERGYEVARPSIDEGFDLLVGRRWRVQVKGSNPTPQGQYVFRFKRGVRADVVLLWGTRDRLWWVVPRSALAGRVVECVTVAPYPQNPGGRGRPPKWADLYECVERWDVFDA